MCKILIVEDEEIEKIALKQILIENVNNVEIVGEAGNGYEAIRIIDKKEIDLVFMDINIPGIDGLQVVKYIKNKHPEIIIIIITAYDEFEIAHKAIKLKVNDYLLKPVKPTLIVETLEQYFYDVEENNNMNQCNECLKKLRGELINKSYINCSNIIKEYIYQLHDGHNDINVINKMILELGKGIIKICREMNFNSTNKVIKQFEKIKVKITPYDNKYYMYNHIMDVVNIIFDEIINDIDKVQKDIKNVINYIERNIKNGVTLEEISNHVNMSVYHLSKVFKKEMNINFITYITDRKIELAKDMLLNTDAPILNIAIELSY
ncbi:MAG: response regulator, partial [Tissierellia bacterium]|nr:response regulator [Tissierellia bacterium]